MRVEKFSAPRFFVLLCVSLAGLLAARRPEPTTAFNQDPVWAAANTASGFRRTAQVPLSVVMSLFISKIVYEFSTRG